MTYFFVMKVITIRVTQIKAVINTEFDIERPPKTPLLFFGENFY